MVKQPDRYSSFSTLREHETEGVDYRIRVEARSSPATIIAPHGGFIEPTTSEIALEMASDTFSAYCFEGLRAGRAHHELHITSDRFDEPKARALVSASSIVVAIHGRIDRDDPEASWVGGLDEVLRDVIVQALSEGAFRAVARVKGEPLAGTAAGNICNGGKRNVGVQLEIPRTLRDELAADSERLRRYAASVRQAIRRYMSMLEPS
ncbi:poly-gamma-glutamate hydrolase family protein [Rhizobium rhizogenes]|uniref:poly-gamma-glutamate hydrolase family protein n=1 Tax=Rhizobium TaxID=379 RepID=UPI00026ED21F|nr:MULTISPECIES: poly-gamma-glutamate hydrolase family protein [Rhizobium]EJK84477.1 phage-related replication protein [Rhizobium sp. AP16]NTF88801.1 poly-gamma-glutamate hydrolase family protein [Rhizobium rhizogenes]